MTGELFGGTLYLEGELEAGAKIGWGLRKHVGDLSQDIAQQGDDGRRPTETAQFECDFTHVRPQAVPYLESSCVGRCSIVRAGQVKGDSRRAEPKRPRI